MIRILFIGILVALRFNGSILGQFAPAAGESGSTALYKDDPSFVGWASGCIVKRGFINISDTTRTFTQDNKTSNHAFYGSESMALGKPGGALDCISLGDGGIATLTFEYPIQNRAGFDFAVFENGLKMQEPPYQYFLELAFVEVSSNGKRFVRFPSVSNTSISAQIESFGQIDPTKINNLAGKYVANYGTPFDLEDIKDSAGINLDSIRYVRLIDVVGSVDPKFGSRDSKGQIINDPFPTEFWSCGFDLDAVGVIHFNGITSTNSLKSDANFNVYPNPVGGGEQLNIISRSFGLKTSSLELLDLTGKPIISWMLDLQSSQSVTIPSIAKGVYLLRISDPENSRVLKITVN